VTTRSPRTTALASLNKTAQSRVLITLRQMAPAAIGWALVLWTALIAVRGALLALRSAGIPIAGEAQRTSASPEMLWAAVLVYLVCFGAAVTSRRFFPAATLPVTLALGGVVVVAGAIGTRSVAPLVVVLTMVALSSLVGSAILRRLPTIPEAQVVRVPIAFGLGVGVLGLLLFLLATFRMLNAATVLSIAGIILLFLLIIDRDHLAKNVTRMRSWHLAAPAWLETVVVGLTVGFVSLATLEVFAPETATDAMWQHLPIARDIWQSQSVTEFPLWGTSLSPIQGHLMYAVAYGFGGMTAAKLVHTILGLMAILGVAGISWLAKGRVAATVSAAVLATMPLVMWELGHAFMDFFPIFFTVAAVLCILLWQRDGMLVWLISAGAMVGFGFAAKQTMGLQIVALATAIVIVGRGPWQRQERVLAVGVFGLGAAVVVVPWLLRGYAVNGTILVLSTLVERISSVAPGVTFVPDLRISLELNIPVGPYPESVAASARPVSGIGHSPLDFLRTPWSMTFHGEAFGFPVYGRGEVGIAVLLLLPLALLGPRTRATALLTVTMVVSYLVWWLTPSQILRHLLPTLAVAAALCGIGVASITAAAGSRTRQSLAVVAAAGVLVGLIATPLLFLLNQRTDLPIDLITGRETTAEYISRKVSAATVLAAATAKLPPDAVVWYIGYWAGSAQIYTESRLKYFGLEFRVDAGHPEYNGLVHLGTKPDEVLTNLDRLDIDYIIWDRELTNSADWHSTLLSTEFLRNHTRILAGDRGGYLFEILRSTDDPWGTQGPNLLKDPTLDTAGGYGPWTTTGQLRARRGVVSMRAGSSLAQRVSVSGANPYLLVVSAACHDASTQAELTFRWFDDHGDGLGVTTEVVVPGVEGSDQFLWHRAPEQAAAVSVELASRRCAFDEAALYASN
jgi:4-amino-4-deoxy-L-arabinose transferase-like glycosyltransferase